MYSATFIFAKGEWDDEFYRLDEEIARIAKTTSGYLGEESWENTTTGLVSNVYYWQSLESLEALMRHPAHLKAKSKQSAWLNGYRVVISQVLKAYGDQTLNTALPPVNAA